MMHRPIGRTITSELDADGARVVAVELAEESFTSRVKHHTQAPKIKKFAAWQEQIACQRKSFRLCTRRGDASRLGRTIVNFRGKNCTVAASG
jgi:hypothetical protein